MSNDPHAIPLADGKDILPANRADGALADDDSGVEENPDGCPPYCDPDSALNGSAPPS